ncbi:MAG: hypothetical protein QXI33_01570 [Candidatus Pacearchaeota archaeon]
MKNIRQEIIIVPINEEYVRKGIPRIQVPYSIIDSNIKQKETKREYLPSKTSNFYDKSEGELN